MTKDKYAIVIQMLHLKFYSSKSMQKICIHLFWHYVDTDGKNELSLSVLLVY